MAPIASGPFRINAAPSLAASRPAAAVAPALSPIRAPAASVPAGVQPMGAVAATVETSQPPAPEHGKPPEDEYFTRLVKLVPSEILALYLTFKEAAAAFLGGWALVCLLLVIFVRTWGTKKDGKPIQLISVLVASVSFILWIYATGGYFPWVKFPEVPGLISVVIGFWTFVIPFIYKGD